MLRWFFCLPFLKEGPDGPICQRRLSAKIVLKSALSSTKIRANGDFGEK